MGERVALAINPDIVDGSDWALRQAVAQAGLEFVAANQGRAVHPTELLGVMTVMAVDYLYNFAKGIGVVDPAVFEQGMALCAGFVASGEHIVPETRQ